MKKLIFATITAFIIGIALYAKSASASQKCDVQYGGQTVCVTTDIDINKKVKVPKESWKDLGIEKDCKKDSSLEKCNWRDNFVLTDLYKFSPNQDVEFQITIENVSQKTFGKVEVRDTLPSGFTLLSNQSKFNIENFKPGDKTNFYVQAKIASSDKLLPKDQDVVCPANKAEAWSDGGTFQGDDTAQVCVNKKGKLAVLPKTGFEHIALFMFGFITTGAIGIYLLKKSS